MLRMFKGRRVVDVPLPGDEALVVEYFGRFALRRDSRFNWDELVIYLCTRQQLEIGFCLMLDCPNCGGSGWETTEYDASTRGHP